MAEVASLRPPIALTSSPASVAPASSVRRAPRSCVAPSFADLHAAVHQHELSKLAHEVRAIEEQLGHTPSSDPIVPPKTPSFPGSLTALDVGAGLRELLGERASEIPAVYEVEDALLDDAGARELLQHVARGFRVETAEPFEIVVGAAVASVRGIITPLPPRTPAIGTILRVDGDGDIRVSEAPPETIAWLDEIALGDVTMTAARVIAMSVLHLRRVTERAPIPVAECRRVARALVDLDPSERKRIDVSALGDDPSVRALACGLATVLVAEHATSRIGALRAMTTAALLQPLLDRVRPMSDVAPHLAALVLSDPTLGAEVVIAHEAQKIRFGHDAETGSLQARMVALACDEVRPSLLEVELELADFDEVRPSIKPPDCAPDGRTTLSLAPVARILAMARDRRLDGTVLLRDPNGRHHAIVLRTGVPLRARTHALVKPLGARLTEAGAVDVEAVASAVLRAASEAVPLGVQLVRDRLASPESIDAALAAQHLDRIRAIARLPSETEVTLWLDADLLSPLSVPLVPCDAIEAIRAASEAVGRGLAEAMRNLNRSSSARANV